MQVFLLAMLLDEILLFVNIIYVYFPRQLAADQWLMLEIACFQQEECARLAMLLPVITYLCWLLSDCRWSLVWTPCFNTFVLSCRLIKHKTCPTVYPALNCFNPDVTWIVAFRHYNLNVVHLWYELLYHFDQRPVGIERHHSYLNILGSPHRYHAMLYL